MEAVVLEPQLFLLDLSVSMQSSHRALLEGN
jgi:hypothetical protein